MHISILEAIKGSWLPFEIEPLNISSSSPLIEGVFTRLARFPHCSVRQRDFL